MLIVANWTDCVTDDVPYNSVSADWLFASAVNCLTFHLDVARMVVYHWCQDVSDVRRFAAGR